MASERYNLGCLRHDDALKQSLALVRYEDERIQLCGLRKPYNYVFESGEVRIQDACDLNSRVAVEKRWGAILRTFELSSDV